MLSIRKFVVSDSTSGPSYETNPNWPKISSIRSMVSRTGVEGLPRDAAGRGRVTSTVSASRRAAMAKAPAVPRASASAASTAPRTSLTTTPIRGRSSGGRLPMPRMRPERAPPFRPR